MKTLRYIALAGILLMTFSCELPDDTTLTVAQRLEGRWKVNEDPIDFKNAQDFYYIYIDIYEVDDNTIAIDNFFDLHEGAVYATISGMNLDIAQQELGGYSIYGSGTIASDFKKITWQYFVDEGSGVWHPTTAVYEKADY